MDLNFAKGMQGKVRYSSFGAVTGTFSKNQEPLCIAAEAREILQPVNAEWSRCVYGEGIVRITELRKKLSFGIEETAITERSTKF